MVAAKTNPILATGANANGTMTYTAEPYDTVECEVHATETQVK